MTKGNPKKEISKVIRERLANGETKADIFKYLQTQFNNDDLSALILTVSPYPDQCQKCRKLNHVLIAILVVIAIAKVLFAGLFILSEIPKAIPLLLIVPLLNIYLIYLVAKFNILGYGLICCGGVLALCDLVVELGDMMAGLTIDPSPVNIIIAAVMILLVLAAIVLAVVLIRRLLPNSTFFLRPRKNEAGEYIF
jgi:hypothetical protein